MPRFHNVNCEDIQFTPEEEIARDAEEANVIAAKPNRKWLAAMGQSDAGLPRYIEDIYDAMTATQQDKVDAVTRDKIVAKKTLRGQKP